MNLIQDGSSVIDQNRQHIVLINKLLTALPTKINANFEFLRKCA